MLNKWRVSLIITAQRETCRERWSVSMAKDPNEREVAQGAESEG